MPHLSKKEQRETMLLRFVKKHCEMPFHWCATGEPIPTDARLKIPGADVLLRKRYPCEYYNPQAGGCTNIKHPKFSAAWQELNTDRRVRE